MWFDDGKIIFVIPFSWGHKFQALMEIIDSMEYMANGGVKDVEYLAKQFTPVIQKIDP